MASPETNASVESDVWTEEYRPDTLDDVLGQDEAVSRLKSYVGHDDLPHLLFSGPAGTGKTTTAIALAKDLFGDDWESNFLELNASDDRGIDAIRTRVKEFAESGFSTANIRLVFLDEADSLTSDAQAALRRVMEEFASKTRFILSCNYQSELIDPIQSRCAMFRFGPLPDSAVRTQIERIVDDRNITIGDDAIDALVYAANGDMRGAVNGLQAAVITEETVTADEVYKITSTARPEEVYEMIISAQEGDMAAAREQLVELVRERGISGPDLIRQVQRATSEFDIEGRALAQLMRHAGNADYRITAGADAELQLESLLAGLQ